VRCLGRNGGTVLGRKALKISDDIAPFLRVTQPKSHLGPCLGIIQIGPKEGTRISEIFENRLLVPDKPGLTGLFHRRAIAVIVITPCGAPDDICQDRTYPVLGILAHHVTGFAFAKHLFALCGVLSGGSGRCKNERRGGQYSEHFTAPPVFIHHPRQRPTWSITNPAHGIHDVVTAF